MDLNIKGKRALVCASTRGIGKAVALALAQEEAKLFLCARSADSLEEVAEKCRSRGAQSVDLKGCDLSDSESRKQLIEAINTSYGGLDILIHNVGGPPATTVEETGLDQWLRGFEQLFQSVVELNAAFLPGMKERKWGRIINVTSLSVMEPIPALAISNGIRAGVTAMFKTLSSEVAPFNVTVNCVAPGSILTDRTEERIQAHMDREGGSREDVIAEYVKLIPAGRLGTPEEFADAVAFLASDRASYITGSTICVDGGRRKSSY